MELTQYQTEIKMGSPAEKPWEEWIRDRLELSPNQQKWDAILQIPNDAVESFQIGLTIEADQQALQDRRSDVLSIQPIQRLERPYPIEPVA